MSAAIGVAAACMARGLTADETEEVWSSLKGRMFPLSAGFAYRQIEDAIDGVVSARDTTP